MAKKYVYAVVVFAAIILAYILGMEAGKARTISESTFFIVDYNNPVIFNGNEYDTSLYIEIDGNVYEQGLYVG